MFSRHVKSRAVYAATIGALALFVATEVTAQLAIEEIVVTARKREEKHATGFLSPSRRLPKRLCLGLLSVTLMTLLASPPI